MTLQDLSSATWYLRTKAPDTRWYRVHAYLLYFASILLIVDTLYRLQAGFRPILEAAVAVLTLGLVVNWYWRGLSSRLAGCETYLGRYVLEADVDGIRLEWPHGLSQIAWTGLRKSSQNRDTILLFYSPMHALSIPKRACSREQLEMLLHLVRTHVPAA